jgi:large subunit ribosomal protein L9
VVKVADGYGRNYLLPGKLAIEATAANKVVIEQMKNAASRKSAGEKDGAVALGEKLDQVVVTFERKAGEGGHLFGSVTNGDIAKALEEQGFTIDRRKVYLDDPLKTVGEFHVPVKLHREVTAHVQVTIKSDAPEAAEEIKYADDDVVYGSAAHDEDDD